MATEVRRATWWLGACQCVFWGLLYYGFVVLLLPMEQSLGASRPVVAGAFSLALLVMALAAPQVGRWLDAGHARSLFLVGTVSAVLGLGLVALAPGAAWLYAGFGLVGLAMAMLLYESAFGLVIRAVPEPGERLRALAAVSVAGGLASTLCLPPMAWAVSALGWREATLAFAVLVAAAGLVMQWLVLPRLPSRLPAPGEGLAAVSASVPARVVVPLSLHLVFGSASFVAAALATLLVPRLVESGAAATAAASVLGVLGVMQLPGRFWVLRGRGSAQRALVSAPLCLQALGLVAVALLPGLAGAVVGVALFGLGAGLHTLARPWLVQALLGVAAAGQGNGRVARVQGLARAAAPVLAALPAMRWGSTPVLLGLAALMLLWLPLAARLEARVRAA